MRLFWSLLSCATACWMLAETIWAVYTLFLQEVVPSPSWADVGYLLAIPLAVAALLAHPTMKGNGTGKARAVFDAMGVATALLFLSWTLVIGPLWRSSDLTTSAGIVTLAYPFGDVVIVFFVVLTIRGMTGSARGSLWCLLAGLLAMAISDSTYAYLTEVANYSSSSANLIDVGWIAAYLGIALAAFSSEASTAESRSEPPGAPTPSLPSLVSPLLPVLLALIVAGVQVKLGHRLDHAAWLIALGLIAIVLARQGLAIVELLGTRSGGDSPIPPRTDAAFDGPAVRCESGGRS